MLAPAGCSSNLPCTTLASMPRSARPASRSATSWRSKRSRTTSVTRSRGVWQRATPRDLVTDVVRDRFERHDVADREAGLADLGIDASVVQGKFDEQPAGASIEDGAARLADELYQPDVVTRVA